MKNDNIEIVIGKWTDEVINQCFESLLARYQIGLEKSVKGNDFVFDYVDWLYYKCHKFELQQILYRFSRLDKNQKSYNKP